VIMSSREELMELVREIRDGMDLGQDVGERVRYLQSVVAFPEVVDLLRTDCGPEYIVDRIVICGALATLKEGIARVGTRSSGLAGRLL
jgi:hypothetical protein